MIRALVIMALLVGTARAETTDRDLVYAGLALTPPMYLLGVGMHEGSHALAAKLVGGTVMSVRIFPPGIDPKVGRFRFGWTYVRGLRTRTQKQLFYVAPKITNAVLLGGFAALVFTDAWPTNRYGQLALTVFATGMWVDFSKDVLLFHKGNDVVKLFHGWCMTGWRQVPARLVYAGAIVGLGAIVARGFQRTFDDPEIAASARQLVLPVVATTF
ncbi:MAG: M50 family metallopeptidase [Deltaproteobacteria bacterium]|nr:M50 family metallopeptidase [Deltaproteobacteria bacterium]